MNDDTAPECLAAREALSALVDGEDPGLGADWLTQHLVGCSACRQWYAAAQDLRRRTRVQPVPAVPTLTARILHAAEGEPPVRRSGPEGLRAWLPRCGAALVAVALLWLELPLLVLGRDPDAGVHPAHELGSFEVALSLFLLVAVVRPTWGRRIAPVVGTVALLLVATAVIDLLHGGRTSLVDEAPHLLWLLAWLCLLGMPAAPPRVATAGSGHPTSPRQGASTAVTAHETGTGGGHADRGRRLDARGRSA